MKSRWLKNTYGPALLVLACVLGQSVAQAQEAQSEEYYSRAGRLAGTWRVQISLRNCETGVLGPPFHSLLSFARGGTFTGTTMNPVFAPGQRTPDFGVWSHLGGDRYNAASEAFLLFDSEAHPPLPGFEAGRQRISQKIVLKTEDEFVSDAIVEFFDTSDNLLKRACASATGRRFR